MGYSPWDRKESDMTEQLNNRRRILEIQQPGPTSRGSVIIDLVGSQHQFFVGFFFVLFLR